MNKKYVYFLIGLLTVSASIWIYLKANTCKTMGCRVEAKTRGLFVPSSDTLNVIKANNTIVFVDYERDGVAHHDYEYYKSIDNNFFANIDEESFRNDEEAGGYLATVHIYKALKKGDTEIVFYKKPFIYPANDTGSGKPIIVATYKFHIE